MPPLGEPSRAEWTRLAEEALRQLWDAVAGGRGLPGTALAAVGSLGRGDCGPESDLDLVLLHRSHRAGDIDSLADALWYPLWDSGIELDHSVRSLDECRGIAAGDLKASISLLDLRWIAGDADLVERAARSVHADWRATARLRFPEIEALQRARVARAGELAYEIEGDVKEAAGGMRDATFVRALVASWLAERPVIDYEPSYRFLLDVRDALATVTRRHQHALRIQSHDDVAAILGFEGPAGADELLARVSGAARVIRGAYEDTAARARRNLTPSIVRPRIVRGRRRPPLFDDVAPRVGARSGELVLGRGASAEDPGTLFALARESARTGMPIRQKTLVLMREMGAGRELGRTGRPWPGWARRDLESILASGPSQLPVWEHLDLAGLLTELIPAWQSVRNLPQRSALHRHTVDRHQLEAVSLLPRFEASSGERLERLSPDRRRPLLLSTLFHDIGKRPGTPGHSERGAAMIEGILAPMGYPAGVRRDVALLVRHHLLLPRMIACADPADPATARAIAEAVGGDGELLACLHLLVQADASACKEEAWDAWKAGLVDVLVHRAQAAIA